MSSCIDRLLRCASISRSTPVNCLPRMHVKDRVRLERRVPIDVRLAISLFQNHSAVPHYSDGHLRSGPESLPLHVASNRTPVPHLPLEPEREPYFLALPGQHVDGCVRL